MRTLDSDILREARKHLGLSQMEAAELLEVSLVTYQRWEQGKARPQPYHLRQLRLKFRPGFQALGMLEAEPADQGMALPIRQMMRLFVLPSCRLFSHQPFRQ